MSSSAELLARTARAVMAVVDQRESLETGLPAALQDVPDGARKHLHELLYGALRWHGAYSAQLKTYLKKPFKPKDRCLHHLMVVSLYQLDALRTPAHAAVSEAVSACQHLNRDWAKGVMNGVLRRHQRQGVPLAFDDSTTLRCAFPEWLVALLRTHWGDPLTILAASNAQAPMSLRVNPLNNHRDAYLQALETAGIQGIACQDSPVGIKLKRYAPVATLPGFASGQVSVQDESAQLAAPLLVSDKPPKPGEAILDACAAPGGKTLHLAELAPQAVITALDLPERLPRLNENLARSGCAATVIAGDLCAASGLADQSFDKILLDVPCTGTGVMRRHPDIRYRRTSEDIARFTAQQDRLLACAWQRLKPGGVLLYTTCSILPEENEDRIQAFLASHPGARVQSPPEDLAVALGSNVGAGWQRLPGRHPGDGFYYGLLGKQQLRQ